jgi:DNA-binding MarR family transcriptional regulator
MSNANTPNDAEFNGKKSVSIFFTTPASKLSYTDLLDYCYRAEQDRFGTTPSFRRIAKRIGLKEETISASSSRLRDMGLLTTDYFYIDPCPRLDWFQPLDSLMEKKGNEHSSRWFRNWRCYVRQPGPENPLTVPSTTLYSLIRSSAINGWKPREGWSIEYLALATGISSKTVRRSLDTLVEMGFLSILDEMRFRLFKLRPSQLGCFADNRPFSGTASEPDEFVDDFAPASDVMQQDRATRLKLAEYLKGWPIDEDATNRVYKSVVKSPNWTEQWKDLAYRGIEQELALLSAR